VSSPRRGVFQRLSQVSRRRKLELLQALFPLQPGLRTLELGGELGAGKALVLENHPDTSCVTLVNLNAEAVEAVRKAHPKVRAEVADARQLPFADQAFDLVFSNAVIEHVGDFEDQKRMAEEIMRIGRAWFVTTPNRWFPFEFHLRLPFVSWLPAPLMKRVARLWSYNHVQQRYVSGIQQRIRLLDARELRRLFPGSQVVPVRVTIWPETLVVIGGHTQPLTSATPAPRASTPLPAPADSRAAKELR